MAALIAQLLEHHEPVGEQNTVAWTSPARHVTRTCGYAINGYGVQPHDRFYVQTGVKVAGPADVAALLFITTSSARCTIVDPATHVVHSVLVSATVEHTSANSDNVALEALDVMFTVPLEAIIAYGAKAGDAATVYHAEEARKWFARRKLCAQDDRPLLSSNYSVVRTLIRYIANACKDH